MEDGKQSNAPKIKRKISTPAPSIGADQLAFSIGRVIRAEATGRFAIVVTAVVVVLIFVIWAMVGHIR
jgi:hypothetical protein